MPTHEWAVFQKFTVTQWMEMNRHFTIEAILYLCRVVPLERSHFCYHPPNPRHIHTHTYPHIYVGMCVYVYMCVCVCICIYGFPGGSEDKVSACNAGDLG